MKGTYFINHEEGLITLSSNGEIALDEVEAVARECMGDPSFDPYLPQLVDLRGMQLSRTKSTSAAFRTFLLNQYRPRVEASMAIVVDESLDEGALAGLYHMSCSMEQTELFDSYEQGLKWLMRREFADVVPHMVGT